MRLLFLSLLFAAPTFAQTLAILPVSVEGDADSASSWQEALTSAARQDAIDLVDDVGGHAVLRAAIADALAGCLDDEACVTDAAGALGASHALVVKISSSKSASLHLYSVDPSEELKSFTFPAKDGADLTLAAAYLLAAIAPSNDPGTLAVTAKGPGVAISVDGAAQGDAPVTQSLPAGVHLLTTPSGTRFVHIKSGETLAVDLQLGEPVAAAATGGGKGWAWTTLGIGTVVTVAAASGLGYSYLEAERITQEIREGNANKSFSGKDDPDFLRVVKERDQTHLITAISAGVLVAGASLMTLGTTLLFTE